MRYYDLDISGKVKGSYAVPQPGRELIPLDDALDDASKYDGLKWIPDQEKIDARLAADKKASDISAAKERVKSISADCEKANDIDALKMIVLDLVNQVKVLIT